MEEIKSSDGKTIAIVVRKDFATDEIDFVSKEEFPLQLGVNSYKKGSKIRPHYHLEREIVINKIQEIVHIEYGKTIVDLYDLDCEKIRSVELSTSDTIFFVEGGHGFEILEDTKIIEVKQGPYGGRELDKKMIGGSE